MILHPEVRPLQSAIWFLSALLAGLEGDEATARRQIRYALAWAGPVA